MSPIPVLAGTAVIAVSTFALPLAAIDRYELGPDSLERAAGAPEGRVETFEIAESKVFPETRRDGWIYIPAQHDGSQAAALMVFQDGHAYVSETGQIRAPIVLDNLIHRREIPVTVGIFLNPGHRGGNAPPASGWGNRNNRSVEYDSPGDAYVRFLADEVIPFAATRWKLNLSSDPRQRAICGMSSGGICAFTAAWERPDQFGAVLSHIGSFTNIRGGHVYPALIRKTQRKPIRVYLQDGANDLNNQFGNWPLANHDMASALAFAGYDFHFVYGDGAHNGKHGGAIFPDSVRWLFQGAAVSPAQAGSPPAGDALAADLAASGKSGAWEVAAEGYTFVDAACGDSEGNFYFSDLPRGAIYKIPAAGGPAQAWLEGGPRLSGMKMGGDGKLYAASQGGPQGEEKDRKRIVAIDPATRNVETVAVDVQPNDLVVSRSGWIYFTDTVAGAVARVPAAARELSRPPVIAGGMSKPNGIALNADHTRLFVSEHEGTAVWTFLLADDGSLRGGERTHELVKAEGGSTSGGDGMAVDAQGRIWVTSHAGIQVLGSAGQRLGVAVKPQEKAVVSCDFGGPGRSVLYVLSGDKVHRRAR